MNGNTNSVVAQQSFIQPDNFRLTRSLWFLLFTPDAGHHAALLEDDIPDVYRRVRDAVLGGTLPDDSDPEALDLLAVVTDLKTPRKLRRTMPAMPDDLGGDFFTHAAQHADGLDLPGGGEWPATPEHTCAAKDECGTVFTIRPHRLAAAKMYNPTWRSCKACLHERAIRIARQVRLEMNIHGALFWHVMTTFEYGKWCARMRQFRARTGADVHYKALPTDDGLVFVMATAAAIGGPMVPTNRAALVELITNYCNTPDGLHIRGSHGFGGDWQGTRGDGRILAEDRKEARERAMRIADYRAEKRAAGGGAIQRFTDTPLEQVADAMGKTLRDGQTRLNVQIKRDAFLACMTEHNVTLRDKRHRARVTSFAQKKPGVKKSAKVVTDSAMPTHIALPFDQKSAPIPPDEVPIWPIYLR